jgi:hypothetical protein
VVLAAAGTNHGICEEGGESEFTGSIDDLGGSLPIYERFCNDERGAQSAHRGFGRNSHEQHIPFVKVFGLRNPEYPPATNNSRTSHSLLTAKVVPDQRTTLKPS